MKICLINFCDLKCRVGGAPVSVKVLAKILKEKGLHDVFVITTGPKTSKLFYEEIQYGIKVYRFYPFGTWISEYKQRKMSTIGRIFTFLLNFWNPHSYFIVKKILKKEKPDVVHVNLASYLSFSVYSAAKSLNLPIVLTVRGVYLLYPFNNLPYLDKLAGVKYPFMINYKLYVIISKIYREINKIFHILFPPDIVIFPTKAIRNKYLEYNFFNNSKKIVFPNLIIINETKLKKEERNKETFDIIYAGGFQKHKGGHTLIKAFKKINDKNIRLHIFGGGIYEKEFKKLAENDNRIIFHGNISNEEMVEFYKFGDITVLPSICFENFSRVLLESLANGLPVIASNVGGNPELIKEGYNGFLFEPDDVEELKGKIEYAISHKEKLKEMWKNCISTARKYSAENCLRKLEEIHKEAIKLNQIK